MPRYLICVKCEKEYDKYSKRVGFYNECNSCGEESDEDTPRLGGVLNFEHKTAPTLQIMSLEDAQTIRKKTDRVGGQGIIRGMSARKS